MLSNFILLAKIKLKSRKENFMNQLAKYLTMKIVPQEYKNDFDKIEKEDSS